MNRMKEDGACQKILKEMIAFEIIDIKHEDAAWSYLKKIYALGHDEGNSQLSKRKQILQSTKTGEPIKIWESLKAAAAFYNVSPRAIRKAANGTGLTSAGFKWSYVDQTPPNVSEPTVGPPQSKSTLLK